MLWSNQSGRASFVHRARHVHPRRLASLSAIHTRAIIFDFRPLARGVGKHGRGSSAEYGGGLFFPPFRARTDGAARAVLVVTTTNNRPYWSPACA